MYLCYVKNQLTFIIYKEASIQFLVNWPVNFLKHLYSLYVTIEVTELIVLCNLILSTYEQDQKQPRFYFKGLALEFTQVQVLRQKADRNKVFVIFKITSHNTFDLFFYVQGMRRTCKNGFVPISLFK